MLSRVVPVSSKRSPLAPSVSVRFFRRVTYEYAYRLVCLSFRSVVSVRVKPKSGSSRAMTVVSSESMSK